MAEAIGLAASIVQIAGFGLNAARSLNQLRRRVGSQAANLERLEVYVESTSNLLQRVKRHVEGDDHLGTRLDVNLRQDIQTTLRCVDHLLSVHESCDDTVIEKRSQKESAIHNTTRAFTLSSKAQVYR